jgi:hypothetical protein
MPDLEWMTALLSCIIGAKRGRAARGSPGLWFNTNRKISSSKSEYKNVINSFPPFWWSFCT